MLKVGDIVCVLPFGRTDDELPTYRFPPIWENDQSGICFDFVPYSTPAIILSITKGSMCEVLTIKGRGWMYTSSVGE